jgi:cephalosporin-C deacetylase-like acetyl esterase
MFTARFLSLGAVAALALASAAADFSDVDSTGFGSADPRTAELSRTMSTDARRRMQEANLRESREFAALQTRQQWEAYRDVRLQALRDSLGTFPEIPRNMTVKTTRTLEGDGYRLLNTLYESRPGFWVAANLYVPAKPPEKMPGIVIAHSHHGGKSGGELQDMGMTWARAGVAVLVPDQLGYGERRQHDFHTEKDYPQPFRASRQDYFFRYNSNLQLSAIGDSLMGWMVWDLQRGVDVLLQQPTIDPNRIIMMGSVAGGGDPAGVAAALDPRIACAVPFNFGGWQPESSVLDQPDRDFAWFGDGYWESTRGLRGGAAYGFAHFVVTGSVAPRKLLYSHEFAWNPKTDPAWPRLKRIFGFYEAQDALRTAHGTGSLKEMPPESSHCSHIGAVHRRMIHPALRDWFGIPVPEEYSRRRPAADLLCWTDEAKRQLRPKSISNIIGGRLKELVVVDDKPAWAKRLGNIEPHPKPRVQELKAETVAGFTLTRFAVETDPEITVPLILIAPKDAKGKRPVVVMVASGGKQAFLKHRNAEITTLLEGGIAVCLMDVRGTGETRPGTSAVRGSARTSISQTNLILGQPILGSQLRDLRTVLRWLKTRDDVDAKTMAVWGDSFAKVNEPGTRIAVPLDAELPAISEPGGAFLALLAGYFETDLAAVYCRGGLDPAESFSTGPYLYLPHDAVIPSPSPVWRLGPIVGKTMPLRYEASVDAQNRATGPLAPLPDGTKWLLEQLATHRMR